MNPQDGRPWIVLIAAAAIVCPLTAAPVLAAASEVAPQPPVAGDAKRTVAAEVPAFAANLEIFGHLGNGAAFGHQTPAKNLHRAGRPLELRPPPSPESATFDDVRVVVRSDGAQALISAAAADGAATEVRRFTPARAGTCIVATTGVTAPAKDGSRLFTSEKLFLTIAPNQPDALPAGPSASATARFGHRLELTPVVDPTHLAVGSDLPVRLKFDGSSVEGATVRLSVNPGGSWSSRIVDPETEDAGAEHEEEAAAPIRTMRLTTDAWGAVNVPIRSTGLWTLSVEHRPGNEPAPAADRFTASIAFIVTQTEVRPVDEPERTGAESRGRAGVWEEWGPAPIANGQYTGRIAALACSRVDPDRYYVGGADGGVWRSTDGGATWTVLTDDMPTTAIGALAIDPNDENIIYAGTGEANFAYHSRFGVGILKSTDGGDSWTTLAESTFAGRCISRMIVDPSDSSVVYAACTPAGGFIPAPASAAKGHPQANDPVGLFKSTDGGASWTPLTNGLPALAATDLAMSPDDPQVLCAAIGHIFGDPANGVYRSDDGGASWTKLAGGFPTSDVGRISLAAAPSDALRLYAAVAQAASSTGGSAALRGVYRSDDGGDTWTPTSAGNYMSQYGWYFNVMTVQPTNGNVVFGGGMTMTRSTTGGGGWSDVTPPHVDLHALEWDAAGRLLAGDDGGLHRSTNLGDSWVSLNDGLGIIQFYAGLSLDPVSPDVLFGGTQDNGTNKRTAPGQWTNVFGGDGGCTAVNGDNPNIVFCEYQGTGNLYRSANGGYNWSWSASGINSGDRNCFLPPFDIDPSNPQRMVYGTHRVYESTGGGTSWSPISDDLTATSTGAIHSIAIAPSNPQTIWATTNDGNVQVTFDGGTEWNLVRQNLPGWFRIMRQVFVSPENHLVAYLAGSAFGTEKVLRTTDGGQSWTPLDGDLPDLPVNVVAVDTRPEIDVIFAGAESGVYRSVNDGASWHRFGEGMPNTAVIDLRLDLDRARLIAATQGRGAWKILLCAADVNGDGTVDVLDLLAVLAAWGNAGGPEDINGDGIVDVLDLLELLAAWGSC